MRPYGELGFISMSSVPRVPPPSFSALEDGTPGSEGEVALFLMIKTTTTMIKKMFNIIESPRTPPRIAGVTIKDIIISKTYNNQNY